MNLRLRQRVLGTIARHRMFRPGDRVGVGVSGGADSVALLHLLGELRESLGIHVLVAHFNHQLRGAESDADERFVAELASRAGFEFVAAREDVAAAAREQGWNLEDAARRRRYEFFSRVVDSGRATRIAVAHTADDQAETLLAHLVRGTGPTGLAAIYPVAGHVVRPLLEIRRTELREYLTSLKQSWREDETNLDTSRLRARIRHRLLPQLASDFGGAIVPHLGRLAELARQDEAFWGALLDDRFHALVESTPAGVSIRAADLLAPLALGSIAPEAHEALTRRLARRILEEVRGNRRQFTAHHVEQVVHLATSCSSGQQVHLPAGVVVERSFDRLVFSLSAPMESNSGTKETGSASRPYEYVVEFGEDGAATVSVPEIGRRFRLKVVDWPPPRSDTSLDGPALDLGRLRAPLILRNWRPGDRYRPQGRQRARKLKRLLLESRVALRDRKGWPVLTSAGELAWARGLPVAAEFAPQEETRSGLLLAEEDL